MDVVSANVQALQEGINNFLNLREQGEFMEIVNDYNSRRNVYDFIHSLNIILDTPAKRQLLILLRKVIPAGDVAKFDQLVSTAHESKSLPRHFATNHHTAQRGRSPIRHYSTLQKSKATFGGSTLSMPGAVSASGAVRGMVGATPLHMQTLPGRGSKASVSATRVIRKPISHTDFLGAYNRTGTSDWDASMVPSTSTKQVYMEQPSNPALGLGFSIRGGAEHGIGIYVSYVDVDSIAERQGLAPGDQVLNVNGISFRKITHEEAARIIKSSKKLDMEVRNVGRVPGSFETHQTYTWVDSLGRTVSPPPEVERAGRYEASGARKSGLMLLKDSDERKINLVVSESKRLGVMVRGGNEFGLGIYVTGVDPGSVAENSGLKVGDQLLDVNGTSFLDISHNDAVKVVKSSRHLMMTIKDVGKLPYARTTYDQTQWIRGQNLTLRRNNMRLLSPTSAQQSVMETFTKSQSTDSMFSRGAGSQLMHNSMLGQSSQLSAVEESARQVLSDNERATLSYYLLEYQKGFITIDALLLALFQLLTTRDKFELLNDIRGLITPKDIEEFDTEVLHRESRLMRSQSVDVLFPLPNEQSSDNSLDGASFSSNLSPPDASPLKQQLGETDMGALRSAIQLIERDTDIDKHSLKHIPRATNGTLTRPTERSRTNMVVAAEVHIPNNPGQAKLYDEMRSPSEDSGVEVNGASNSTDAGTQQHSHHMYRENWKNLSLSSTASSSNNPTRVNMDTARRKRVTVSPKEPEVINLTVPDDPSPLYATVNPRQGTKAHKQTRENGLAPKIRKPPRQKDKMSLHGAYSSTSGAMPNGQGQGHRQGHRQEDYYVDRTLPAVSEMVHANIQTDESEAWSTVSKASSSSHSHGHNEHNGGAIPKRTLHNGYGGDHDTYASVDKGKKSKGKGEKKKFHSSSGNISMSSSQGANTGFDDVQQQHRQWQQEDEEQRLQEELQREYEQQQLEERQQQQRLLEQQRQQRERQRQQEQERVKKEEYERRRHEEYERQKQQEFERQKQQEYELQKQQESERQKQQEYERHKRQEYELQKQREYELQEQREYEREQQQEFERQKQREFERQKQQEQEREKQLLYEKQQQRKQEIEKQRRLQTVELQQRQELERQRKQRRDRKQQEESDRQQREVELLQRHNDQSEHSRLRASKSETLNGHYQVPSSSPFRVKLKSTSRSVEDLSSTETEGWRKRQLAAPSITPPPPPPPSSAGTEAIQPVNGVGVELADINLGAGGRARKVGGAKAAGAPGDKGNEPRQLAPSRKAPPTPPPRVSSSPEKTPASRAVTATKSDPSGHFHREGYPVTGPLLMSLSNPQFGLAAPITWSPTEPLSELTIVPPPPPLEFGNSDLGSPLTLPPEMNLIPSRHFHHNDVSVNGDSRSASPTVTSSDADDIYSGLLQIANQASASLPPLPETMNRSSSRGVNRPSTPTRPLAARPATPATPSADPRAAPSKEAKKGHRPLPLPPKAHPQPPKAQPPPPKSQPERRQVAGGDEGRVKELTVPKCRPTLGIAIEGGANTRQPLPRVINIQPNGSASQCKGLKVGDVILEINGRPLEGLVHRDCAKLIAEAFKSKTDDKMQLVVLDTSKQMAL